MITMLENSQFKIIENVSSVYAITFIIGTELGQIPGSGHRTTIRHAKCSKNE